jgi:hypothetical protein
MKEIEINASNFGETGVTSIKVVGIKELPKYFYNNYNGFTYAKDILSILGDKLNSQFELIIVPDKLKSVVEKSKGGKNTIYSVKMTESDFKNLISRTRIFRTKMSKDILSDQLSKVFPKYFPVGINYKRNTLKNTINSISDFRSLSSEDVDYTVKLYNDLKQNNRIVDNFETIKNTKKDAENLVLKKILKELQDNINLKKKEEFWQKFFEEYILFLNDGYSKFISQVILSFWSEKNKKPDFLMLTSSNYLDVVEIKRPDTELVVKLKGSKSRNNYIWSEEMNVAISQVENYLNELNQRTKEIKYKLEEEVKFQISEARIIRPRGFIIVGKSSLLENEESDTIKNKKRDDFRLLCDSLKNIQIILYDDYILKLTNMLNFLS